MTNPTDATRGLATQLVHTGEGTVPHATPVNRPVYASTTWLFDSAEEVRANAEGRSDRYLYTRYSNPTIEGVEQKIALIEGGETALLYASGMAATAGLLLGLLDSGDEVTCATNVYGGTYRILRDFLTRFGITVRWVQMEDLAAPDSFGPATKLLWFETPTNPTLRCVSLDEVARACQKHSVLSVCDNTFAGPLNQRPLERGVDIVMHSATKSLNGHSDVTAGVLIGKAEMMDKLNGTRRLIGGTMDPQAAANLGRGLKTLPVRNARYNETALHLAEWLEGSGLCQRVWYPGLASHPDHEIARTQMKGFGGMICIDAGSEEAAHRAYDRLGLICRATSLGGVESLCALPTLTSHYGLSDAELQAAEVTHGMLRLSIGLEEFEDLRADLEGALSGQD